MNDGRFTEKRTDFCGCNETHVEIDGRCIEFALGHREYGGAHRIVKHRGENASLNKAGRIYEFRFAHEPDANPTLLRFGIDQMPTEQTCARWGGNIIECGLRHRSSCRKHSLNP